VDRGRLWSKRHPPGNGGLCTDNAETGGEFMFAGPAHVKTGFSSARRQTSSPASALAGVVLAGPLSTYGVGLFGVRVNGGHPLVERTGALNPRIGVDDRRDFLADVAIQDSVLDVLMDHDDPLAPPLEPFVIGHSLAPANVNSPPVSAFAWFSSIVHCDA
jgi:hypothetical protein